MKKFIVLLLPLFILCKKERRNIKVEKKHIVAYNVKMGNRNGVHIKDIDKNMVIKEYIPEWEGEYYSVHDTIDVTGDGIKEIIIEYYSGGAHCCYDYIFIDIRDGIKEIWRLEAGNGSIAGIEDIDGDGINEIITLCDCLAYFDELPYYVYRPLPRIFKYKGGSFKECTLEYPWIFDDFEEEYCEGIKEATEPEEEKSSYLALLSIYILKGEILQGSRIAQQCGASQETVEWFMRYREELLNTLKKYYKF